jgi:hypothetical protein
MALLVTGCTCVMTFGGGMLALRIEAAAESQHRVPPHV